MEEGQVEMPSGAADKEKQNENPPKPPTRAQGFCLSPLPKACKNTKRKSEVWKHFTIDEDLKEQCSKSPLRVVDQKQKTLCFAKKEEGEGKTGDGPMIDSLKTERYNEKLCRNALSRMIIVDELPFKYVEKEGFRYFCSIMEPRFPIPCHTTVARDCMKMFYEEKEKLKTVLRKQRICLTTDTWTSIQNLNYMCLTAHWIDDGWNLNKKILNFCQVPNHKGETIGWHIENCLLEWGIDRIFTVTVDNASSNDGAIRFLKRRTKYRSSSILDHEFIHMRCCTHIVNLIVSEGLKEHNESIVKIRNAVKYVMSSPSRLQTFKDCVRYEKIYDKSLVCLDDATRWNSTCTMLEAAEKFQKAFERLEEDDPRYLLYFMEDEVENENGNGNEGVKGKGRGRKILGPPKMDDWDKARIFIRFLRLFYNLTLKLSGSLFVTSDEFFHELVLVQYELTSLTKSGDKELGDMAISMKKKHDKYWENLDNINFLLYIAVVLDPRFKLRYVRFSFAQVYDTIKAKELTKRVKLKLIRLYEHYVKKDSCANVETSGASQVFQELEIDENKEESRKLWAFRYKKHLEVENSMKNKSEVERFLAENCEDLSISNFDILDWWKLNRHRYRILSQIARDVLAVPVSTMTYESAFSTGGHVLDPFRSSLTPKMVEALICAQNWLQSSSSSINLKELLDEFENYEEIESEFTGTTPVGLVHLVDN